MDVTYVLLDMFVFFVQNGIPQEFSTSRGMYVHTYSEHVAVLCGRIYPLLLSVIIVTSL